MSNFEDTFKALLLEFLKRQGIDAVEVIDYTESARSYQVGCETCGDYDTDFEVDISYRRAGVDDWRANYWNPSYTYDGSFAGLIAELAAIDTELNGEVE